MLASLSLTVLVFTFVLLVGNLLKEILSLLVNGQVRIGLMLEAIGLLVPFLWVYALPMGLLTATLLVFGRFSADQELTAARASGVSLLSLIMPILLLSLVCCGLSAWINLELGPQSRVAYKNLIYRARYEMANWQLPENTYVHDIPGYICYAAKNRGGLLRDVEIMKFSTNADETEFIRAETGRLEVDKPNELLHVYLTNVNMTVGARRATWVRSSPLDLDLKQATNQVYHPKISDMTFGQLCEEMRTVESHVGLPPSRTNSPAALREIMRTVRNEKNDATLPVRVEMSRQIAFSFASFGFALVGIPLGIRVHRKETNIGIAVALGLAVVYYTFILVAESLAARPEFYPQLILWLPNFIFQAVGAVLLWRANKGF